jgi:nucleoporin GLE1
MVRRKSNGRLLDSPSKQLFLDLAKDLEAIHLHSEELKKVDDYNIRAFQEHQDELDRKYQEMCYSAIDAATAVYDQHRAEAEAVLQDHLREEEEERRRQEAEAELRAIEELLEREAEEEARQKAEQKAREEEARKKAEEEKKKAEEEKKKAEEGKRKAEEAAKARKAEEEEKARHERERLEEEERQRKAAHGATQQKVEKDQAEIIHKLKQLGAAHRTQAEINEQGRYLQVHHILKGLRRVLTQKAQTDPNLKETMGDLRRSIVKCIGQLREGLGAGANKKQVR